LRSVEEGNFLEIAMTKIRYPSFEEMRALERAARKARSRDLARLVKAALLGIKNFFSMLELELKTER
jgi:hypothetical protein